MKQEYIFAIIIFVLSWLFQSSLQDYIEMIWSKKIIDDNRIQIDTSELYDFSNMEYSTDNSDNWILLD